MKERPLSYWVAVARMGFENDFNRIFDELDISRVELAKRVGASPAYVSKVLNGGANNFQLATMAKWARAIGAIVQVRLIKEGSEVVRVVDHETARALDDERLATPDTSASASSESFASVTNIRDYLPAGGGRVKKTTLSRELPMSTELMERHG